MEKKSKEEYQIYKKGQRMNGRYKKLYLDYRIRTDGTSEQIIKDKAEYLKKHIQHKLLLRQWYALISTGVKNEDSAISRIQGDPSRHRALEHGRQLIGLEPEMVGEK